MSGTDAIEDKGLISRLIRHVVLVPMVVFLSLLGATTFVWHEINQYQLSKTISDANEHLEYVSAHLTAHIDVRLVLGELIREEWRDSRSHMPEDFAAIVAPKLKRFEDIQAINWVDAFGVIRWVNPLQGNEGALGLDIRQLDAPNEALSTSVRTASLQVSAPIDLAQGGRGFVLYLPVFQEDRLHGFINIVFRADKLIDIALPHDRRRNYDLHITDSGISVFDGHIGEHLADPSTRTINVANRTWAIAIAPVAAPRESVSTVGINLLLLTGLIFSVVLPLMLYAIMQRQVLMRETERKLADFADISSDWFWETDDKLRFSYFSSRFEEVTGIHPDDILGKTREEVGAPGADPEAYKRMQDDIQNRLPFRDFEHSRQKPGYGTVFLSISGRPAYDENGDFTGYRGIGRDITQRILSQRALNDALVASEQANRAKSEFLATMSHEFRTPLNAIIGFSEMLKEEYFGKLGADNYVDYAKDIHSSGRHMLDLVNDILDFSAIEASKRAMQPEQFSFEDVLKDGCRNLEQQIMSKGLGLNIEIPDGLPELTADKRSIYQVILNLLSNAVKFTEPGGEITVAASVDADSFCFTVTDTGSGIAANKLATITEPFAQSHDDPHLAGTGTGLGLTIVKSLIDAHHGELLISSEFGKGTQVTVRLPRHPD